VPTRDPARHKRHRHRPAVFTRDHSPADRLARNRARGGRLYVSIKGRRCCGGAQTLAVTTEAGNTEWRSTGSESGFELFLPAALARRAEELHVEVRRFPRRVEAYWNGCAWIV
jgi:hypothetical protein